MAINIRFYFKVSSSIFSLGMRRNQHTAVQAFLLFLPFLLSFFSDFLLWFCWPFSCLCAHWTSFHLNVDESELFWTKSVDGREGHIFFWFWRKNCSPLDFERITTVCLKFVTDAWYDEWIKIHARTTCTCILHSLDFFGFHFFGLHFFGLHFFGLHSGAVNFFGV